MKKILSSYYFNFVLGALLACVGCYVLLADTGALDSLPLIVLCGAACGLLEFDLRWKCALFAVFALVYAGLYSGVTVVSLLTAAGICVLIALLALIGALLLRKKRVLFSVLGAFLIVASLGAHYVFYGDAFSAYSADSKISSYLSETYNASELDGYSLRFDYTSRVFRASVSIPSDPTNDAVLVTCSHGEIDDGYMKYVEKSLMKNRTIDLTTAIRDRNPKSGFRVYARSVKGFPSGNITIMTEVPESDVSYYVYITNEMGAGEFCDTAKKYVADIVDAGMDFDTITFIGGAKGSKYYQLTLCPSLIYGNLLSKLEKYDYITFSLESDEYSS